jgi:hypothetical protein
MAGAAVASGVERPNALHVRPYEFPLHFNPILQAGEVAYTLSAQLFAAPLRFDSKGEAVLYLSEGEMTVPNGSIVWSFR